MKVLLFSACILVQLIVTQCAAPGDEDHDCVTPSFSVSPPDYGPNQRPLMDSRHYKKLLEVGGVWKTVHVDGDLLGWRSGIGGQCQRESRSCTGNRQQENYVVTQYIQAEGALEILIQLGYRFTSCSKNNCALDVLIYETCEEGGDEDPNNYRKLFTVTASNSAVSSLERQFSPTNIACGFYLALRENGTCVSIYYMALYSYQCPSKTSNLVNYPTTDSPAQDSENPVETTGTCSNYSSQDDGETLNPALNCGQEGQWTNEPSCYCNPGYWHDPASDTCNPCGLHTYNTGYGNGPQDQVCLPCPKHSVSGFGATECDCKPTFYRTKDEGPEVDCSAPPSTPLDLTIEDCTNTTVSLCWEPPSNDGERSDLFYRVIYQRTDSLHLGFNVAVSSVHDTCFNVTGLEPLTDYKVYVVSENAVSSEFLVDDQEQRSSVIDATTKEGVPEKITLFAKKRGDTFTWQPPANTNGKLTGFDFRIFYKGKEDEAVVVELDVLDFCYSPLTNEIPSGSGDLCVQVRAKTEVGPGEWSDAIIFEPADTPTEAPSSVTDCPTCEAPTECPTCEAPTECPTPVAPTECPTCEAPPECPPAPTCEDDPEPQDPSETPSTRPARITNVLAAGDDIVVWDPPSEEVDFYVVRISYRNSANKRAGILLQQAPKNQPWLEILQTFTDPSPTQGVQYYFQVRARNSAGVGLWSQDKKLP